MTKSEPIGITVLRIAALSLIGWSLVIGVPLGLQILFDWVMG